MLSHAEGAGGRGLSLHHLGWGLMDAWDIGGISVFFLSHNSSPNSNGEGRERSLNLHRLCNSIPLSVCLLFLMLSLHSPNVLSGP